MQGSKIKSDINKYEFTKEELLAFGLNKDDLDELLLADYVARNAKNES